MTVIDTSLVFPHYYGIPFRRSLKSIVQSYLKHEIQAETACGHDSYEDARSGVELMLWKVQQDFCQQSSSPVQQSMSTSPRQRAPIQPSAATRIEPTTPASVPTSGSGACGSSSSVSSQYSTSTYSATPPTSTSFWRVVGRRRKLPTWDLNPQLPTIRQAPSSCISEACSAK